MAAGISVMTPTVIQLALFFPPDTRFKALAMASQIDKACGPLFTADPILVPVPADAPLDIPRVVLQQDKVGQVQASFMRLDFHMAVTHASGSDDFVEYAKKLARAVTNDMGIRCVRLGLVINGEFSASADLARIREKYFVPGKMNDVQEINLGWLRRIESGDQVVNRWVRLAVPASGKASLMIDMNTLMELQLNLDAPKIEHSLTSWLDGIWGDMDGIIEW